LNLHQQLKTFWAGWLGFLKMKALITGISDIERICPNCKKIITHSDKRQKFCNRKCRNNFVKGKNHPLWKGGIKHRPDGYLRNSQTDQYIHRETMEQYLGRKLEPWEHIHHKNGDNTDNRIENLEILTNSAHRILEVKKQKRGKNGKFRR